MRTLILILAALAVATPAAAHRQPEVETTIASAEGEAGPVLQITHRLHAHDAQAALALLGADSPQLSDPENQARLALYVLERFDLTGDAQSRPIGVEAEGNYLYVYVEHPEAAGVEGSAILADVDPAWVNFVHLEDEAGDTARTLIFQKGEERLAGPAATVPGLVAQ